MIILKEVKELKIKVNHPESGKLMSKRGLICFHKFFGGKNVTVSVTDQNGKTPIYQKRIMKSGTQGVIHLNASFIGQTARIEINDDVITEFGKYMAARNLPRRNHRSDESNILRV